MKALWEGRWSWDKVQELVGISRATSYPWDKALREGALVGLKPKSRRPRRPRGKVYWKPELMVRVEVLRKENARPHRALGGLAPMG